MFIRKRGGGLEHHSETVWDLVRASADLLAYLGVAGSIEIIVNI